MITALVPDQKLLMIATPMLACIALTVNATVTVESDLSCLYLQSLQTFVLLMY